MEGTALLSESGRHSDPASWTQSLQVEEEKAMSDIITCFGETIVELVSMKELILSLLAKELVEQDFLRGIYEKLNTGHLTPKQGCQELFNILKRNIDENQQDLKNGKLFVQCLKTGHDPSNQILARFIEGTGKIPAHDPKEQEFRRNFVKNLPKLRSILAENDAVEALQENLGHQDAYMIANKGHDGSIDKFLLLVFTLTRSAESYRQPVSSYLRRINKPKLASCLDSIKDHTAVDEDDIQSFSDGFDSLGEGKGDEGGCLSELDEITNNITASEMAKIEVLDEKDSHVKENNTTGDDAINKNTTAEVDNGIDNDSQSACLTAETRSLEPVATHDRPSTTDEDNSQAEKGAHVLEDDDEIEPPEFYKTLRKYQVELAGSALNGKNTIIIAPTGTGKTHVAAYIINKHFCRLKKEDNGRIPKVVFVVHTKVLADQQHKKLEELIGSSEKEILSATGERLDCPLAEILRISNVVVLTAQVLLNGLAIGEDRVEIDNISLLIFDECHNCHKGHPFNQIMHHYHEAKRKLLDRAATKKMIANTLPQIIGMTASIGTGKGKSSDRAFEHILETCANLDTHEVQTVGDKEDLQKYLNIPEEIDPHIVPSRKKDPLKDALEKIMSEVEIKLRNEFEGRIQRGMIGDVAITCNGQRDSQIYEGWIKKFERESVNISLSGKQQETVRSCLYSLLVYNRALCLNRDVRMKDALSYLKASFDERRPMKGTCNEELLKKFDENLEYLENISTDDNENPALIRLRDIIVMEFTNKPESRALLFTPTVQSTKALKDWIEETKEFNDLMLNPSRVTGASELTTAERNNTIRKFRSGEHKLLVVTNVVEQGMDIPECNLVFRLNYIPSDTGHIQVKGRNRAKEGKSYLVASSGHGNFKNRELSNRIRENMMTRLLERLKTIPPDKFAARVQKIQDKIYKAKKREEDRRAKMKGKSYDDSIDYNLNCGNCKTFACKSTDVVCLRTYHTVQKESFKKNKIEIMNLKATEADTEASDRLSVGTVRCKKCKARWGSWVKFESMTFAAIQIYNFELKNMDTDESQICQQWGDAPFEVQEVDDLDVKIQNNE